MHKIITLVAVATIILVSCKPQTKSTGSMAKFDEAPEWAASAIWYQIFVERFRNGNPNNDPTMETNRGALIDEIPASWQITPWGTIGMYRNRGLKETGLDFYRTIQMRRYGGDLEGVMQK